MRESSQRPMSRLRTLVLLWVLASLAALTMPLFDLTYLHPEMTRLMTFNVERDARRLAEKALNQLAPAEYLRAQDPQAMRQQLEHLRRDLDVLRLTLMSPDGTILQAAAEGFAGGIGQVHLRQVLTTGRSLTRPLRVAQGGMGTTRDLMLLTLPIHRGDEITGAFELVYDWTDQRRRLDHLVTIAATVMILVPLFFLSVVGFIASRAFRAVRQFETVQNELAESKRLVEAKHDELTELFRQIEQAKEEWQVSMDCIDDMVLLVDKEGLIRRCNDALHKMVSLPYTDILGKNWRQVLFGPGIEVVSLNQQSFQLYHRDAHKWLNLNFYPYKDRKGASQWSVITIRVTASQADGPPDKAQTS